MLPDLLRARRRALIVMLVVAIASLLSGAGALHARSIASIDPTIRETSAARSRTLARDTVHRGAPAVDTADVHDDIRKLINRFQDLWRKTWQDAEMSRHKPVDFISLRQNGELSGSPYTPELQRYLSAICIAGSPDTATMLYVLAPAIAAMEEGPKRPPGATAPIVGPAEHSPLSINAKVNLTLATDNMVVPRPNYGPICPNWIPKDAPTPSDEGAGIDNALPIEVRLPVEMARDTLIKNLTIALMQHPEDEWIAGQLVRFTIDQRVPKNSVRAALRCKQLSSTCASLQGLAFEQAKNYVAAEAAFRRADSIEASQARNNDALCVDEAVLMLLRSDDRDVIRNVDCATQRTLVDRMWWLADPLWSIPGNERLVAHGSRLTSVTLRSVTNRDERYVWDLFNGGSGLREVVIRYGWPSYTFWPGTKFQNQIQRVLDLMPARKTQMPYSVKEYHKNQSALIPRGSAIADPFHAENNSWDIWRDESAQENKWWAPEYMTYATRIMPMAQGQDVMWRRDAAIVYQLAVDDPLSNRDTTSKALSRAQLWGGTNPKSTRKLADALIDEGHTLRLKTTFSSEPRVMSAEILPRTPAEQAQRNRYGVIPPPTLQEMKSGEFALSDPVVMRMPNRDMALPTDESEVLRYMAGGLSFPATEPVALYWESYGFAPGDTVQIELRIRRDDKVNAARRVGALLGVASALRDSVSIKWTEPDNRHRAITLPGSKPVVGRSLAIDLTALAPGSYVVSIEMRKGATISARGERRFEVNKP